MQLNIYKSSLLVIAVCYLMGCTKTIFPSAEVSYLGKSSKNVIRLRAFGYSSERDLTKKDKLRSAIYDAERRAMEILLYKGIPESSAYEQPLIRDGKETEKQNTPYFDDFYGGGYRDFVISSKVSSKLEKDVTSRKRRVAVILEINIKTLKHELIKNNIISAFGRN